VALEPGTPVTVAPGVPDQGRAWELVTSPEPLSAFLFQVLAISADGNRVSHDTFGPLPDSSAGQPLSSTALATRGPGGWMDATQPPPLPEPDLEPLPVAIAPDFESSIWRNELPSGEAAFFRRAPDGQYTQMVAGGFFSGASTNLQSFIVSSGKHLLPGDASRTLGESIYEMVGSTLSLVDVDDSGHLLSDCGSTVRSEAGAISNDGQRIFFSTSPGCTGPVRVYMRTGGAATTQISASQCDLADCGPEADATFAGASPSGSSAFLVTEQRLTDGDSDSSADLYRYDVASGNLSLVTSGPLGDKLIPTTEAVRISADESHLYFGAVEQTGPGETSEPRLYMEDSSGLHLVPGAAPSKFVQLSEDGRYAVFATKAALVAGDTDESSDVYRYDAQDGTVTQISIGPLGGNGPFDATIESFLLGGSIPAYAGTVVNYPYRAMSEDGSRIFFETAERLVPEDRNETTDVYEWANGSLGLVSAGAGTRESNYVIATPDGKTVFFMTGETLLPLDRNGGNLDLYAARIGGGFPEAAPAAGCGDTCRAAPRGRSDRPLPATAKPGGGKIEIARIAAADRRRIAATGWIDLLVEVPRTGKLSAAARARLGGHERTVASTATKAAAGAVRLRMRLSGPARRSLAQGHRLRLQLLLRLSHLDSVRRVGFVLGGKS
jgi:hypothetical protein